MSDATDADLAAILNARASQATDTEISQPASPERKITIKVTPSFILTGILSCNEIYSY